MRVKWNRQLDGSLTRGERLPEEGDLPKEEKPPEEPKKSKKTSKIFGIFRRKKHKNHAGEECTPSEMGEEDCASVSSVASQPVTDVCQRDRNTSLFSSFRLSFSGRKKSKRPGLVFSGQEKGSADGDRYSTPDLRRASSERPEVSTASVRNTQSFIPIRTSREDNSRSSSMRHAPPEIRLPKSVSFSESQRCSDRNGGGVSSEDEMPPPKKKYAVQSSDSSRTTRESKSGLNAPLDGSLPYPAAKQCLVAEEVASGGTPLRKDVAVEDPRCPTTETVFRDIFYTQLNGSVPQGQPKSDFMDAINGVASGCSSEDYKEQLLFRNSAPNDSFTATDSQESRYDYFYEILCDREFSNGESSSNMQPTFHDLDSTVDNIAYEEDFDVGNINVLALNGNKDDYNCLKENGMDKSGTLICKNISLFDFENTDATTGSGDPLEISIKNLDSGLGIQKSNFQNCASFEIDYAASKSCGTSVKSEAISDISEIGVLTDLKSDLEYKHLVDSKPSSIDYQSLHLYSNIHLDSDNFLFPPEESKNDSITSQSNNSPPSQTLQQTSVEVFETTNPDAPYSGERYVSNSESEPQHVNADEFAINPEIYFRVGNETNKTYHIDSFILDGSVSPPYSASDPATLQNTTSSENRKVIETVEENLRGSNIFLTSNAAWDEDRETYQRGDQCPPPVTRCEPDLHTGAVDTPELPQGPSELSGTGGGHPIEIERTSKDDTGDTCALTAGPSQGVGSKVAIYDPRDSEISCSLQSPQISEPKFDSGRCAAIETGTVKFTTCVSSEEKKIEILKKTCDLGDQPQGEMCASEDIDASSSGSGSRKLNNDTVYVMECDVLDSEVKFNGGFFSCNVDDIVMEKQKGEDEIKFENGLSFGSPNPSKSENDRNVKSHHRSNERKHSADGEKHSMIPTLKKGVPKNMKGGKNISNRTRNIRKVARAESEKAKVLKTESKKTAFSEADAFVINGTLPHPHVTPPHSKFRCESKSNTNLEVSQNGKSILSPDSEEANRTFTIENECGRSEIESLPEDNSFDSPLNPEERKATENLSSPGSKQCLLKDMSPDPLTYTIAEPVLCKATDDRTDVNSSPSTPVCVVQPVSASNLTLDEISFSDVCTSSIDQFEDRSEYEGSCASSSPAVVGQVRAASPTTGQPNDGDRGSKIKSDGSSCGKSRIPLKHMGVARGGGAGQVAKPARPPAWLSKTELSQEIHRLGNLCEARTKELTRLKMETKHVTVGFDAFAALFKYMVEDLNALSVPALSGDLQKTLRQLELAKQDLAYYETEVEEMKAHHCQELNDLSNKLFEVYQGEITELSLKHQEELNNMKLEHDKKMEKLSLTFDGTAQEIQVKHNDLVSKLQEELTSQREELQLFQEREIRDLEEKHAQSTKTLQEHVEQLQKKCSELKQHSLGMEDAMQKDTDTKLQWVTSRKGDLEKEVESLKAVLEMKNKELHSLRVQTLEMEKQLEDLPLAREKIKMLQARAEDLEALMAEKTKLERKLLSENQEIQITYEKESKVNRRLSMENEELQWRLRQAEQSLVSSFTEVPENPEEEDAEDAIKSPISPNQSPSPRIVSRSVFFTFVDKDDTSSPHGTYKKITPGFSAGYKTSPARAARSTPVSPYRAKSHSEPPLLCSTPRKTNRPGSGKLKKVQRSSSIDGGKEDDARAASSMASSISSENSAFGQRETLLEEHEEEIRETLEILLEQRTKEPIKSMATNESPTYEKTDMSRSAEFSDPKTYYHMTFEAGITDVEDGTKAVTPQDAEKVVKTQHSMYKTDIKVNGTTAAPVEASDHTVDSINELPCKMSKNSPSSENVQDADVNIDSQDTSCQRTM